MSLLIQLISIYEILIIFAAVLSWVMPDRASTPILRILEKITQPALNIFRPILPRLGGVDISPAVVILALELLKVILGDIAS